jgi:preprotein translocase subunit YajC
MKNVQTLQVGSRVRHIDGMVGQVIRIEGEQENRLIEWVYCGNYRVSGESVLSLVTDLPRWRKGGNHD